MIFTSESPPLDLVLDSLSDVDILGPRGFWLSLERRVDLSIGQLLPANDAVMSQCP